VLAFLPGCFRISRGRGASLRYVSPVAIVYLGVVRKGARVRSLRMPMFCREGEA